MNTKRDKIKEVQVNVRRRCEMYFPDGDIDDGRCETCWFFDGTNPCAQYESSSSLYALLTEPGGPSMDQVLGE